MSFTREQFAKDVAVRMGNPIPNQTVIDFIVGWSVYETNTNSGARYNILNTTQPMPGSTYFNHLSGSSGVQNYTSYAQGIQATQLTIQNGLYGALSEAIFTNNSNALNPPSSAVLANLHTWCGSCGYGNQFMQVGPAHRKDAFDYGTATPISTSQSSSGQNNLPSGPPTSGSPFDWLDPMFVGKMAIGIVFVSLAAYFFVKEGVKGVK
jgi:hypothetical protein